MVKWSNSTDGTLMNVEAACFDRKVLEVGDAVIFCAGTTHIPGLTNILKLYKFGEMTSKVVEHWNEVTRAKIQERDEREDSKDK